MERWSAGPDARDAGQMVQSSKHHMAKRKKSIVSAARADASNLASPDFFFGEAEGHHPLLRSPPIWRQTWSTQRERETPFREVD